MQKLKTHNRGSRGFAIVLTTLTLTITVPLVGLGFDVATLYLVKSKLSAAVDAAGLAAARALSQGADPATQKANAITAGQNFFSGNFPAAYWNTTGAAATITVDDTSVPNYRAVNVVATVQAPLYFLRVFNQQYATVAASGQAGRRDALVMLVLDRSSSMNGTVAGTGQTACQIMKTDAAAFVNYFAPGRDQLGLVVFGSTAFTYAPTVNFTTPDGSGNTVQSLIGQISCGGNTASAEAIADAYAQVQAVNNSKRMNVLVFMTDGRPNGVTADFSTKTLSTCTIPANDPGVLAQWAGGAVATGPTAGLMKPTSTSITDPQNDGRISGYSHCNFSTDMTLIYKDLSGMPANDYFGDALAGPYSQQNTAWPYNGLPANLTGVSSPQQIVVASANALDNVATTVRTNTTLNPYIYTIALEGDGGASDQPDTLLLRKIANDPSLAGDNGIGATFYSQQINQPHGYFAEAPDASQLAVAFDTIAAQISIRLAR